MTIFMIPSSMQYVGVDDASLIAESYPNSDRFNTHSNRRSSWIRDMSNIVSQVQNIIYHNDSSMASLPLLSSHIKDGIVLLHAKSCIMHIIQLFMLVMLRLQMCTHPIPAFTGWYFNNESLHNDYSSSCASCSVLNH